MDHIIHPLCASKFVSRQARLQNATPIVLVLVPCVNCGGDTVDTKILQATLSSRTIDCVHHRPLEDLPDRVWPFQRVHGTVAREIWPFRPHRPKYSEHLRSRRGECSLLNAWGVQKGKSAASNVISAADNVLGRPIPTIPSECSQMAKLLEVSLTCKMNLKTPL